MSDRKNEIKTWQAFLLMFAVTFILGAAVFMLESYPYNRQAVIKAYEINDHWEYPVDEHEKKLLNADTKQTVLQFCYTWWAYSPSFFFEVNKDKSIDIYYGHSLYVDNDSVFIFWSDKNNKLHHEHIQLDDEQYTAIINAAEKVRADCTPCSPYKSRYANDGEFYRLYYKNRFYSHQDIEDKAYFGNLSEEKAAKMTLANRELEETIKEILETDSIFTKSR